VAGGVCELIADKHEIKIKSCNYISLKIEMQDLIGLGSLLSTKTQTALTLISRGFLQSL
jgi:hypothetical protein